MCATCGCSTAVHRPTRRRATPARAGPAHGHDHAHSHDAVPSARLLEVERRLLERNDHRAEHNRERFARLGILALNLVSSPGAGKTTLLERTIADLRGRIAIHVIEGDQETSADAERIRAAGARAVQINTGTGCHLDAAMVERGLDHLGPGTGSVLMIENVGNLVCPALFDLGETAKVVVASVTEGEDKPLKYPHLFRAAGLVLLNKVDLLPYVKFEIISFRQKLRQVNPRARLLPVSAQTGEGLDAWYAWLHKQRRARARATLEAHP